MGNLEKRIKGLEDRINYFKHLLKKEAHLGKPRKRDLKAKIKAYKKRIRDLNSL